MARRRVDPSQATVHFHVRVPASVRDRLVRVGGGNASLGLRRFLGRNAVPDKEDAVVLSIADYTRMCAEIERLKKKR